jgi:hypothetical protein
MKVKKTCKRRMEGWWGWRNSQFYLNIAYGDGKFVAVGRDGKAAYSQDGENWTAVVDSKFGGDIIHGITYGGGKFVAVGDNGNGAAAYSPDGITWTAGRKFGDSFFKGVAYGSGKFVAAQMSDTGIAYTYAQE